MPKYAKEARKRYDRKEIAAEEMIRQVYMKANDGSDFRSLLQHLPILQKASMVVWNGV